MREDDDSIRLYAPLVRRIMVLVAVVVAVPVVLWTITAFMRTYVGPPRLPTFRPMAMATVTPASINTVAAAPAAPDQSAAASPPAAGSGGADGVKISVAVSAAVAVAAQPTVPGDRLDSGDSATGTAVASLTAQPPATDTPATPDPVWDTTGSVPPQPAAGSQQASADQGADDLPAPDPIVGPVPLPHPRPRYFAMAGSAVPMPRPRPSDTQAAAAPASNDTALGWLGNLFHPAQQ
jgi:hypothetical protein